jgi:hypothetical protein
MIQIKLNSSKISGALAEDLSTFYIVDSGISAVQKNPVVFPCQHFKYYMLLTGTYVAQYKGNSVLLFHDNGGYVSVPQCYIIHTLPVLFMLILCV